jgi:diguanylate cyclase
MSANVKTERHLRTLPFAKTAIAQIERLGLPADPPALEFWYIYASGHNPAMRREVDAILASKGGLTEGEFDQLCNQYGQSNKSAARLDAVARQLTEELGAVSGSLAKASASSASYDQHLSEGLRLIEHTADGEALKSVVQTLLNATREMEERNQALEQKLADSRVTTASLKKQVETLRQENATDPLTLVGNRQYFEDSLANLTVAARDGGRPLSLLFGDIDHFKRFNDSYGHQIGDNVLRLVASVIKAALNGADVVGRYGGEEFAVIMPDTDIAAAKATAERIRATLTARELKKLDTNEILGRVTMSIGVAQLRNAETPHDLVQRADTCLYAAKRAGRNRVIAEDDLRLLIPTAAPRSALPDLALTHPGAS